MGLKESTCFRKMQAPEVLVLRIGCRRSNQDRQTQEEPQKANGTLLTTKLKVWPTSSSEKITKSIGKPKHKTTNIKNEKIQAVGREGRQKYLSP